MFLLLLPPPKPPTKLLRDPRPVTINDESAVNTVFIFVRCVVNASTSGRAGRVGRGRVGLIVVLDVVVVVVVVVVAAVVVDDGVGSDTSSDDSASASDSNSESASSDESVSIDESISSDESNSNSDLSACFGAINRVLSSLDSGDVCVRNINV